MHSPAFNPTIAATLVFLGLVRAVAEEPRELGVWVVVSLEACFALF